MAPSSRSSVLVIGDELESVIAAIASAMQGLPVTLLRQSTGLLGGLSSRGGLAYMDLTPEYLSPLFAQIIEEAGLKRVALHGPSLHRVLTAWLEKTNVQVVSAIEGGLQGLKPLWQGQQLMGAHNATHQWPAAFVIDATPDATFARACGVPYRLGLGGLFGQSDTVQTLGVSPVFGIEGLSPQALVQAEERLRQNPQAPALLAQCFPWLSPAQRQELLERPCIAPPELDYVDILNPTLGAFYHQWRYGDNGPSYDRAPFWIDGGNVACLSDGTLSFNGLVGRINSPAHQLALSEADAPLPPPFLEELAAVEAFFQEVTHRPQLKVLPPQQLYIRHTLNVQAAQPCTGLSVLGGGVPAAEALGTFSYWLDFRGIPWWEAYPELHPLPKPHFHWNLQAHLPHSTLGLPNLAFVGRSSGFSPLAQGTCRIVQYNAAVAEALGCALGCTLGGVSAHQQPTHSATLATLPAATLRQALHAFAEEVGKPAVPLAGYSVLSDTLRHAPLLQQDAALSEALQGLTRFEHL
jgi:hypothetical protein